MSDVSELAQIIARAHSEGRYESVYYTGKSYGSEVGLHVYIGVFAHAVGSITVTSPAGNQKSQSLGPSINPVVFRSASSSSSSGEFTFIGYKVYVPDMPVVRTRITAVTRSQNGANVFFLLDLSNGGMNQYYQANKTLATAIPESALLGKVYDKVALTEMGLIFQS